MVVALGPGKFYGSSLPRPRIYTDVKFSATRVDPPVSVTDSLISWAHEAHWSMGGLSFHRHRLQGRIEGNINRLRSERERTFKNKSISHVTSPERRLIDDVQEREKKRTVRKLKKKAALESDVSSGIDAPDDDVEEKKKRTVRKLRSDGGSPSRLEAPVAVKRKRRLIDEVDDVEEREKKGRNDVSSPSAPEAPVAMKRKRRMIDEVEEEGEKRRRTVRKLKEEFDLVAEMEAPVEDTSEREMPRTRGGMIGKRLIKGLNSTRKSVKNYFG